MSRVKSLSVALGLCLAAAGAVHAQDAAPVELKLWHAYRDSEEQALLEAARVYKEQTGVQVTPIGIAFGAYSSKVETAVPRGNGPDLLIGAHDVLSKWQRLGVVEPAGEDSTAYRAGAGAALELEGKRYGYPLAFKTLVLLYNPELIQDPPTDTDALLAAAKAHTGGGSFGLAYEATAAYYFAPWMHGFGAKISGDDVHLDSPELIAALAFARRVGMDEGIVPKSPTSELMGSLFDEGKAAFVISGPWFAAGRKRAIAAIPLPTVSQTGLPALPFLGVEGVFVAGQAKHPGEAAKFAAWLAGPEGAAIRQELGGQAVAAKDAPPLPDTLETSVIRAVLAQAETAILMPTDPQLPNVWEALEDALRKVMRGAATPEEAAKGAEQYRKVLSRPPPEAANPVPYVVIMVLVGLGALVWLCLPLRDPNVRQEIKNKKVDYLWVFPAAVAMLALVVVPFVAGAAVSLFAHSQGEWTFVGFSNFLNIVLSRDWPVTSPLSFYYTLVVTILWTLTNVFLHVSIGMGLALVLREPWIRLRGVWRALLIVPWAVPNYITALIWKMMFHVQYGAINALLGFGGEPAQIDWFSSFSMAFSANLITNTWLGFPFMMVVTLGALQAIPRDLEEAAELDGAGAWFRFRHVTWPLLKPALLPALVIGSVWTFNMFNVIYLVSGGQPDSSTEILISEAYRWAFKRDLRYGYAAAYAVLIFGVLFVYGRAANKLAGKKVL
ncbi:MAG: extracellular solute-binding protein [Planctomycetes bacterium]|nr:extracellular solute-binding protein [Planctomycetota bacterium]